MPGCNALDRSRRDRLGGDNIKFSRLPSCDLLLQVNCRNSFTIDFSSMF